jgi:hypothetical protein
MNNRHLLPLKHQLARQVLHWSNATQQLCDLSLLASTTAWRSLERYLGVAIEGTLQDTVQRLMREASVLSAQLAAAETPAEVRRLQQSLLAYRNRYLGAEAVLDFYGRAINSRTQERLGDYLRACDVLAARAIASVLVPLGRKAPAVLTYLDSGLGASILKAGLRLWDGQAQSPVAAIKLARHNLLRPTSLLHEAGHQVAHELGWTEELGRRLRERLSRHGSDLAALWSEWPSEIAADALAFAQTGYGSVAALHDVLAGNRAWVLQHVPGDPHPISQLRVLLGHAMCVRFYGQGPWDDMASAWIESYPSDAAEEETRALLGRSRDVLPEVVELLFFSDFGCFAGKSLRELVDPLLVKPEALEQLASSAGDALFVSPHWLTRECVRLVALSGLRSATPGDQRAALKQQEQWMLRLGRNVAAPS